MLSIENAATEKEAPVHELEHYFMNTLHNFETPFIM